MRRGRSRLSAALVVALSGIGLPALPALPTLSAQQPARPSLHAGTLRPGLKLDGRLDEPVWAEADSIPDLTMIEPTVGGPTTGRTVVRVLADRNVLVIGIACYDPDPSGIVSYAKARDVHLDNEDHLRIVLDTFRDGRSGYQFNINPSGSRFDGLITNQGESVNSNWDAVWEAATRRDSLGWYVEIRIPVRSLIFKPGLDAWGFNLQRRIQRLQETSRWNGIGQQYRIGQTSQAGLLTGLPAFSVGLGLALRPALVGSAGHPEPDVPLSTSLEPSLDLTQRIGSNTVGSLTLNTDFAETEVDARRANITRFPLFYPEKRTFFLEGADIFDFGSGSSTDVLPFFSRRIGLFDEQQVPLQVGGKVNGRAVGANFGALAVHTSAVDSLIPSASMGVLRLRENVLHESSAGIIATIGDPQGRANAWTAGVDLTFQTSHFAGDKNFLLGVWGLGTDHEGLTGDRTAVGVRVDYPNDLWDVALNWKRIGDGFDPSLGFVPRSGVNLYSLSANYQPRPGKWGIRQVFLENEASLATDLSGRWESWRYFFAPINWRLESGDRVEANIVPQGERLTEPFEVAPGVIIPVGSYGFTRFRLEVQTAAKRRLSGQLTWWFGGFYGGTLHQLEAEIAWNPSAVINLSLVGEENIGHLPQGDFTLGVVGTKLRVNFSPNLQLNSFVQYDNESRTVGTNTRLRWSFSPLGDLFVVYNHNVRDELDRWSFLSNQLTAKLVYTFRP